MVNDGHLQPLLAPREGLGVTTLTRHKQCAERRDVIPAIHHERRNLHDKTTFSTVPRHVLGVGIFLANAAKCRGRNEEGIDFVLLNDPKEGPSVRCPNCNEQGYEEIYHDDREG